MAAAKQVPLYYIAVIRIMVGYHFAQVAWGKLNADFYTGKRLLEQLSNVAGDPIALHRVFIQEIVAPNAVFFSYLVEVRCRWE